MYRQKMIIADDEHFTLKALKTVIEQDCPDVEITATFSNGKEAYDYIENNVVDILILDIKMPIMDGIELLKSIRDRRGNMDVIMITGYRDFDYAYQAIQERCNYFLTKPIDYDVMISNVNEICAKRRENAESIHKNVAGVLKERSFIRRDLSNWFNRTIAYDMLSLYHEEFKELNNPCVKVSFKSEADIPLASWTDILETDDDKFNIFCISSDPRNAKALVFFKDMNIKSVPSDLELAMNDLCHIIKKSYNVGVYMQIGNISQLSDIHGDIINIEDEVADCCLRYLTDFANRDKIIPVIMQQQKNSLKRIFELVISKVKNRFNTDFSAYTDNISEHNGFLGALFTIKKIISADDDYDLYRIINFIHDNCVENLRMDKVADYFGYNYSYFSRIFKRRLGKSFSEYVSYVRIEKVKELLHRGMSAEEVADALGYEVSYLNKKFKSETNITMRKFLKNEGKARNANDI